MTTSLNRNNCRVTSPLCWNSSVTDEFPSQRPVTRSFDVFSDLHESIPLQFGTMSRSRLNRIAAIKDTKLCSWFYTLNATNKTTMRKILCCDMLQKLTRLYTLYSMRSFNSIVHWRIGWKWVFLETNKSQWYIYHLGGDHMLSIYCGRLMFSSRPFTLTFCASPMPLCPIFLSYQTTTPFLPINLYHAHHHHHLEK